jgi:hypothetical protein
VVWRLSSIGQGLADASGGGDVVVLDQDRVEEAHAVIGDASGGRGALFEGAHSGGGLARVEDAAVGAGHGVGVLARQRCDAAEALEEIEGDAFALKQRTRIAFHRGEQFAGRARAAIVLQQDDVIEHLIEDFGSGEYQRLARNKGSARAQSLGHAGAAGDITGADIFLKGETNDLNHDGPS